MDALFTRADAKPLSIVAASATAVGLAVGLWLNLPVELRRPVVQVEPEAVSQEDPNLASYRKMMAAEGVSPTPYILASAYAPGPTLVLTPASASRDDGLADREDTAFREREQRGDAERAAWLETNRPIWRAEAAAYRLPAVEDQDDDRSQPDESSSPPR